VDRQVVTLLATAQESMDTPSSGRLSEAQDVTFWKGVFVRKSQKHYTSNEWILGKTYSLMTP
jgi:hypothetical protein